MGRSTKKELILIPILVAFAVPLLIFALHLLAIRLGFYALIPNFDVPMHFAGGMAIAAMGIQLNNLFEKNKLVAYKSQVIRAVFLLAIVASAAMLWEIGEFLADQLLKVSLQFSLFDTMKDMILGLIGGSIVVISWAFGKSHK